MKKRLLSMGLFFIAMTMLTGCSSVGSYYRDGKRYFVNENYEEAAASFSKAIAGNPDRADYYIDYGMTLIKLNKYEDALVQFDLAYMDKDIRMIKENNKRVFRGKGIAYYQMLQYQKATEQFEKALALNELSDLDMDILYYIGSARMTIGSYEQAIEAYTAVLSIDEKNAIALSDRASCYRSLDEYEKSLADYDKAILLKPNSYNYLFGKYFLMKENSDSVGAAEVLLQAAEIKVTTSEDRYNQAKVHYFQENYELALSELSEGFANGFTEAYYYIGEIYRIKKDNQKAIYYYEKFINEGEVYSPSVYNQIGSCLIKTGEYNKAIEYLEKGITYNHSGTLQVLKKNEIIAYESLSRFDVALKKISEYLISYPKDSEALRELEFIKTRLIEAGTER